MSLASQPLCVIIGAGLAGLMAGRVLKERGISFIVLEKKGEIGLPLQCGEGVRRESFLKLFGHDRFEFVKNRVSSASFRVGEWTRVPLRRIAVDYLELDRVAFEKWLAEPLRSEILLNRKCLAIDSANGRFRIQTHEGNLETAFLILASGPRSPLLEFLGLERERGRNVSMCRACGGLYEGCRIPEDEFAFFFPNNAEGYFWIFPKRKGLANIGFDCFDERVLARKAFESCLARIPGLEEAAEIQSLGGLVPAEGPLKRAYGDGFVVAGDAAGFVFSFMGEGIPYALESGRLAGEVVSEALSSRRRDARFLQRYEDRWKASFGEELEGGVLFREIYETVFQRAPQRLRELFLLPSDREILRMVDGRIPWRARLALWMLRR